MRIILVICAALLCAAPGAQAQQKVDGYYSDPAFVPLGEEDVHPLQELMKLAEDGNERAMFILADLYEKGKGGMVRDVARAKALFEESAEAGFDHSLIRLAAIARKDGNVLEAYKWYTLALEAFPRREHETTYDYLRERRNEMAEAGKMDPEQIMTSKRMMREWKRK